MPGPHGGKAQLFEAFDTEVGARAKRAASASASAARLGKQLQKAAESVDIHLLRQKVEDAAGKAGEAAALLAELRAAVTAFTLAEAAAAEVAASAASDLGPDAYARAFERACAAESIPLEGTYPDYRVFPLDIRIRLHEERIVIGKKSWWALRPVALAQAVKRQRDRLMGGAFAADKFGQALVRAYDVLLPEVQAHSGAAARQVALREVLALLQLGTFGRNNYTKDEFAFDLYRYRQTSMTTGGRRVVLGDMRGLGAGFEVPNARGGRDRLTGLQVLPAEGDADGR